MEKPRIVIIGAGFAGISAAHTLSKYSDLVDVTLIDHHENNHFRPLLPDVVSKTVHAPYLLYSYVRLKEKFGFTFYCGDVGSVDFDKKTVAVGQRVIHYDYLIITSGSQTPIPPNEQLRTHTLRCDTVHDANRIRDAVFSGMYNRFVVCGGGYTGVELATHIWKAIRERGSGEQVIIVEMTDTLIGTLPQWMQLYVEENLRKMGIEIKLQSKIDTITDQAIVVSNGETIKNALCIWTTGLQASVAKAGWNVPLSQRGRIVVDTMLQFRDGCFAAGDSACFAKKDNCIRMSVQYSISQGACAAKNCIAQIRNEPMTPFKPLDPGFIVPLANGFSCGEVFGVRVKGRIATFLHYFMSAYRSHGILNRLGVIWGFLRSLRSVK